MEKQGSWAPAAKLILRKGVIQEMMKRIFVLWFVKFYRDASNIQHTGQVSQAVHNSRTGRRWSIRWGKSIKNFGPSSAEEGEWTQVLN